MAPLLTIGMFILPPAYSKGMTNTSNRMLNAPVQDIDECMKCGKVDCKGVYDTTRWSSYYEPEECIALCVACAFEQDKKDSDYEEYMEREARKDYEDEILAAAHEAEETEGQRRQDSAMEYERIRKQEEDREIANYSRCYSGEEFS